MQGTYPYYLGPEPGVEIGDAEGDGVLVVRLVGEFDHYSERLFLGCIRELLAEGHAVVRFDFSEVRFADLCGLRCLFQAQRQFRRAGREVVLTGLPDGLARILRLVNSQVLGRAVEDPDGAYSALSHSFPGL